MPGRNPGLTALQARVCFVHFATAREDQLKKYVPKDHPVTSAMLPSRGSFRTSLSLSLSL